MKIGKLIEKLRWVFPADGRDSLAAQFLKIRGLLLANPHDPEQAVNQVEDLLITAITTEKDRRKKNTYKLALKIVLLSRGYFSDELGELERVLLLMPHEISPLNPSSKSSKYPLHDPRILVFINKIRFKISNCVDQAASPSTKMEDKVQELIRLMRTLIDKYTKSGPDSADDAQGAEIELARQLHLYKIDYLKQCLSKLRNLRILKSTVEHSLWASAVHQAIEDLNKVGSDEFLKITGGGESKQRELARALTGIHQHRIKYFMQRAQLLLEPFGFAAEANLKTLDPLSAKMDSPCWKQVQDPLEKMCTKKLEVDLQTKIRFQVDVECFTPAHALLLDHQKNPGKLAEALNLATQLVDNNCLLGTFIQVCALTLMSQPTKERWNRHYNELQDIVIPACWRFKIAELWLCLSDYFIQLNSPTQPFFRGFAIACASQVTDRFGERAYLMSRLQLARINKEDEQIALLESDFQQLKPLDSDSIPYSTKQAQFLICESEVWKDDAPTSDFQSARTNQFTCMMTDDYPYGIEYVIKILLNHTSPLRVCALEAVQKKYGESYHNPIKLCQNVLKKKPFDRYLMIWGPIYSNAFENALLKERIDGWLAQGLSPNHIKVKLYTETRSHLYAALTDEDALVPGGRNFLIELDRNILQMTIILIDAIEEDRESTDFAFTRDRPGSIPAIFAELALQENNDYVAEQLAQLSITLATAPSTNTSPPRITSATNSPLLSSKSESKSPELPKKRGARRALNFRDFDKMDSSDSLKPLLTMADSESQLHPSLTTSAPSLPTAELEQSGVKSTSPSSHYVDKDSSPTKRGASEKKASLTSLDFSALAAPRHHSPPHSPHNKSPSKEGNGFGVTCIPAKLGYLILAQILWNKSLKNNKNRDASDITRFKELLKSARNPIERLPNDEELDYIKGMIWWNYFDSEYDELWLNDEDRTKYSDTYARSKGTRWESMIDEERKRRYTIVRIIKSYFFRALIKSPKITHFRMFPPAAVAFEKYLWYQVTDFYSDSKEIEEKRKALDDKRDERLDDIIRELKEILNEAVVVHGYIFAEYSLARILEKYSDLFRKDGTLADMYASIKSRFDRSERFLIIDQGAKSNLIRRVEDLKKSEHQLSLQALEEKEKSVTRFGVAINCEDYPARDTILSEIEEEFKNGDESTLPERILTKLSQYWSTEELRGWFSHKSGYDTEPSLPLKRIIKNEFKNPDRSSLKQRILAKIRSELSSLRQPILHWLSQNDVRGELPGTFSVARLLPVNRNFNNAASTFLSECRRSYPPEVLKPLRCSLQGLPFDQKFHHSLFSFSCINMPETEQEFALKISCGEQNNFIDLESLQHCFVQAQQLYCYLKKVTFLNATPIQKPKNNQLIVSHLDIMVFGIIRIIQGKHPGKRIRDSQASSLLDLLREALTLPAETWQWDGTPIRLKSFIDNYDAALLAAGKKEAEARLSPLAICSPLTKPRIASKNPSVASSRRGSSADLHPFLAAPKALIPSSERGRTKKGSGSLKLKNPRLDESSSTITQHRSRSQTVDTLPFATSSTPSSVGESLNLLGK